MRIPFIANPPQPQTPPATPPPAGGPAIRPPPIRPGKGFWEFLRGANGGIELSRLMGAAGTASYILTANALVIYECAFNGRAFDVAAYCLAFPGGLGVAVAATAGAVAIKDRNVAKARKEGAGE